MSTAIAERPAIDPEIVQRLVLDGDVGKLTAPQRVNYVGALCDRLNIDVLFKPFAFMYLQGKLVLYATKACTDQLRKVHTITIKIKSKDIVEDCYIVTAVASTPDGREDEDIGAVPIAGLRGEARANAMMKAITKAKRRVTLSICGLGMLDESEVSSIPDVKFAPSAPVPPSPAQKALDQVNASEVPVPSGSVVPFDPQTGEILPRPGYHYVRNYRRKGPFHTVTVEKWDAQGGALDVSTIHSWGFDLKKAAVEHLAIKITTSPKDKDHPGEAYCDSVEFEPPAAPVAAPEAPPAELPPDVPDPAPPIDDDIPF